MKDKTHLFFKRSDSVCYVDINNMEQKILINSISSASFLNSFLKFEELDLRNIILYDASPENDNFAIKKHELTN
jgi:hypothetical protein